jgi:hypothetical protein
MEPASGLRVCGEVSSPLYFASAGYLGEAGVISLIRAGQYHPIIATTRTHNANHNLHVSFTKLHEQIISLTA